MTRATKQTQPAAQNQVQFIVCWVEGVFSCRDPIQFQCGWIRKPIWLAVWAIALVLTWRSRFVSTVEVKLLKRVWPNVKDWTFIRLTQSAVSSTQPTAALFTATQWFIVHIRHLPIMSKRNRIIITLQLHQQTWSEELPSSAQSDTGNRKLAQRTRVATRKCRALIGWMRCSGGANLDGSIRDRKPPPLSIQHHGVSAHCLHPWRGGARRELPSSLLQSPPPPPPPDSSPVLTEQVRTGSSSYGDQKCSAWNASWC